MEGTSKLLLSIITVNFNDLEGLKKTVKSVQKQTYDCFEHIIIDGGSTDGSKEFIEENSEFFSYWVSEKDSGIYNAMNKGVDKAKGDYLLFLNSGDWLYNNFVFEKFIGFNPTKDIIYGNTLLINGSKKSLKKMPVKMNIGIALTNTINHQTIFFSKNLFNDGSRYDCSYKIVADWIFVNNAIIFKKCTTQYINLTIPCYDVNGVSSDKNLRIKERDKYLKSNFNRIFIDLLNNYKEINNHYSKVMNNIFIKRVLKIIRALKNKIK